MAQTVSVEVEPALSTGRERVSTAHAAARLPRRRASGDNPRMHRWMAAAGISLLMVIACSNTTSTSSPAGPSTSSASASASCMNKTDFDAAVGSAKDHVSSAVTAAAALNLGTAKDELSKAGQAVQRAANIAWGVSPKPKQERQA